MNLNKSEARLQQECYMWFHNRYPELRGLFFRIKNEGTNKITGARDKAMGVIPGVSDMCLIYRGITFIEFKSITGKQSKIQHDWQEKVSKFGAKYYIIRSFEQFCELMRFIVY